MPTQTIDTSARINSTRVYGTLIWNEKNCAATKGVTPAYEGDTEQCDDCGRDEFTVVKDIDVIGLGSSTGWALRCDCCGARYPLRSEE